MRHHKLVMPVHLNHYGYLFGGMLLQWVDEYSWITASLEYPGCKFVTIGMERVEFRKQVGQGSILIFDVNRTREGHTSVEYEVVVSTEELETGTEERIFSTRITFVCLDQEGNKRAAGRFFKPPALGGGAAAAGDRAGTATAGDP